MKRSSFSHSGPGLLSHLGSESDKIVSLEKFAGSRFLCGLSRADIEFVIGAAVVCQFSSNSVVVNQEDPANRLFFLLKGSGRYFIHTHGGRKLLLLWLAPREIFGASALLEQPSRYCAALR